MSCQRAFLRIFSSRPLRSFGERYLRSRVWTIEGGEGAGLKFSFPQNREFISGTSEIPVQQIVARYVRAGDVFYDVGANVGFFSVIAARFVGPSGSVCAFEPVAENVVAIRKNAALNSFNHLRAFEVAVGATGREQELFLTEWDGGSSLSTSAVRPSEPASRRTVRVVPLDDFIAAEKLPCPTFVKIDVEGAELEALQGMERTISEAKPKLLYEVDDGDRRSFQRRWQELDSYVAGLGYTITRLPSAYPNVNWQVGHSLAVPAL